MSRALKGPCALKKFTSGQSNPMLAIDAASGRYVLRRNPLGELLKSAHAVDREFRVIGALANTYVPVASVYQIMASPVIILSDKWVAGASNTARLKPSLSPAWRL